MGDIKNPDRIIFVAPSDEDFVYMTDGVDRTDLGTTATTSSNTVIMSDEKGSYIPCTAGGYHVHRGLDAFAEKKRCDCPHDKLIWLAKNRGILLCPECKRSFSVESREKDDAYADAICALENNGVVSVFTQRDQFTGLVQ